MNTQIEIKENGTTTLATAGKYCDRNIDVNVDISSDMYSDKLVDRSITEFVSKTVTKIGQYGLGYKDKLLKVDLWVVESIDKSAFYNDYYLSTLIIRTPKVCSVAATNAFSNTAIAGYKEQIGYIYVPDDLVENYKVATNWTTYANQIKPISELEE